MREDPGLAWYRRLWRAIGVALALGLGGVGAPAAAQSPTQTPVATPTLSELVAAVIGVKTYINHDGRTIEGLGRERRGSGVVIDGSGLVLTIGYLMVEAHAAEILTNDGRAIPADVVGYDHETGFGLLRAITPLKVKPLALGRSAQAGVGERVLVASAGGADMLTAATIVARRAFAGGWEYLLEDAIFTAPPHPAWSGAALIGRDGRLMGIGSLIVGDGGGANDAKPANMFVPIDALRPILADLVAGGRRGGAARPWLGVTTAEVAGRLVVSRVAPGGPADKAGLRRGEVIVGVNGEKASDMADLYRKIWARGDAGARVALDIEAADKARRVDILSMDRLDHLRLKSTF